MSETTTDTSTTERSKSKGATDYSIHEKALVDAGARIGKGTRVWAFAHVLSGAIIGENCNICDYAFVESGAKLGNNVTVKNGVQVYEGVTTEDNVFLGPNCAFTNDMFPRVMAIRPEKLRAKEAWLVKTLVKEGASIGANATIICGVTIGRYAYVAAGAVVTKNVPDHALVLGSPARVYGWVCFCGQKLEFLKDRAQCKTCSNTFLKSDNAVTRN